MPQWYHEGHIWRREKHWPDLTQGKDGRDRCYTRITRVARSKRGLSNGRKSIGATMIPKPAGAQRSERARCATAISMGVVHSDHKGPDVPQGSHGGQTAWARLGEPLLL